MKVVNEKAITAEIQKMADAGEVTCMGDNLIFHGKQGAYNVGTEDDLVSAWNLIAAYKKAGK